MIPSLRSAFNARWSPEKYERFLGLLEQRFGEPEPFRVSETPCFLPAKLVSKAATAGQQLVQQLLAHKHYLTASRAAIPDAYRTPGEPDKPLFIQADFGIDEQGQLQLVEIQGFPSLYCYQPVLTSAYREAFGVDDSLTAPPDYEALLRRAIVAEHDPENVALLEIDPDHQKTRHDFTATHRLLGIAVVDARTVIKKGNRLFYEKSGVQVPIRRIYNRVIADELERKGIELPFSFRDELDVEWAGHPNWFYLLSKFSLPFFDHPAAPRAVFLDRAAEIDDWQNWVLKPLFSFAGSGVILSPTRQDLDAIPQRDRAHYLLQRRVDFTPCIATPEGPTKIEIRVMYIWLEEMTPVNLIIRMGRGGQMGVDHNKGMGWVGASCAFIHERGLS